MMKKIPLFLNTLLLACVENAIATPPERLNDNLNDHVQIARPEKRESLPALQAMQNETVTFSAEQLQKYPELAEQLLVRTLYGTDIALIKNILNIYRTLPQHHNALVLFAEGKIANLSGDKSLAMRKYREILSANPNDNATRLALAQLLFEQKQDNASKEQFQKVLTAKDLPPQARKIVQAYLKALDERNSWDVSFSFNYLRDTNVNNAGKSTRALLPDGTTRVHTPAPKHAHGFAYSLGLSRDINLWGANYLTLGNDLDAKHYWDNHQYDFMSNRTFVGYAYKSNGQTLRIKPFYERSWYGNKRYNWSNGGRLEFSSWLNDNWQLSTAAEFSKQYYFDRDTAQEYNNRNNLMSATLIWITSPKQFFTFGSDFITERAKVRQYGYDSKRLRLGWGQEWEWLGLSSRLNLSFMQKKHKDVFKYGNISGFSFDKIRKDKIYSLNLMLWKRDWHILGITPKLQLSIRDQRSNIPELYSYRSTYFNIVFEKTF